MNRHLERECRYVLSRYYLRHLFDKGLLTGTEYKKTMNILVKRYMRAT